MVTTCLVVNQIDGIELFVSGSPIWCILTKLTKDGTLMLGVVDYPSSAERSVAIDGIYNFFKKNINIHEVVSLPIIIDNYPLKQHVVVISSSDHMNLK